jgi:hypothetical protein
LETKRKVGRPKEVVAEFADVFIQASVKNILRDIGLDYGLTIKEAEHLYLTYYREFILKNIGTGKFKFIKLGGELGMISVSKRRLSLFKQSIYYDNPAYKEAVDNLYKYGKFTEEDIEAIKAKERKYNPNKCKNIDND